MNFLVENIIPSQIILLLLAAVMLLLFSKRGWLISFTAVYLCAFIACLMQMLVKKYGSFAFVFGGFEIPYGIEYRLDPLSGAFILLMTVGIIPVMIYSFLGVKLEIEREKRSLFYALFLVNIAGSLGTVISYDLFNIYVFIEISSLSAYALVAAGRSRESSFYAYNYLIIGTIGATFYLLGIGILYSITGSLNMGDVARLLMLAPKSNLVVMGYVCIIMGILLKIGIFPFHNWLPNAYYSAPTTVSALFSVTSSSAMIYLLIRLINDVLNTNLADFTLLKNFILLLASLTIILGGVFAIFQKEFRRLLAYSSLANYGMIVFAIALGTVDSIAAALVMLFAHSVSKSALFMSAGLMSVRKASLVIEELPGTFHKSPWTTTSFVINILVVAGMPPFISFFGKWQLLLASFAGNKLYIIVILVGTFLSFIYSLRLIDKVLFKPEQASGLVANSSQILMEFGIVLAGIMIFIMTLFTEFFYKQAKIVAIFLLE